MVCLIGRRCGFAAGRVPVLAGEDGDPARVEAVEGGPELGEGVVREGVAVECGGEEARELEEVGDSERVRGWGGGDREDEGDERVELCARGSSRGGE